jgi:HTH-type transcriptional regulator / antitoxin HigA
VEAMGVTRGVTRNKAATRNQAARVPGRTPSRTVNVGLGPIDPARYGKLCATIVPKLIESDDEFDRLVEAMETIDFKANPTSEEKTVSALLARLIQDYDDQHHALPEAPPSEMVVFLMNQRGLRPSNLLPIFGSRSVASDVLSGKREPSKAHVRKLAEFFHVSTDLFL